MTLKKIAIDNSVRYIPIAEKTEEKKIKSKTMKAGSLPKKTKQKTITKQ